MYTAASVIVIAMIGPTSSRAPTSAACDARLALAHVPLDVLDHDDRVVHDEADREHDREDRQQVQAEAEREHDDRRADQRDRHRDERHERRAHRAHEQEHDQADDQDRLGQRLRDLLQRVLHEHGRVVGEPHLDVRAAASARMRSISARSRCATSISFTPTSGQTPRYTASLLVVLGDHVGLFGAQLDARDVAQAHDRAVAVGDDQVLELLDRAQVGVREQVDLDEVALRLADGGEVVVAPQRRVHVARREVRARRAGRDRSRRASRSGGRPRCSTRCTPASVASCGCSVRGEPVGDRGNAALARREAQVEGGVRPVGALHLDHRRLGLRRQLGAHLLQPRRHLGERRGAAVVELRGAP